MQETIEAQQHYDRAMLKQLERVISARAIERIVHFHCDHFEPLRPDITGVPIGLAAIKQWNETRLQHWHSQTLSLFYCSQRYCGDDMPMASWANSTLDYIPPMYPIGHERFADIGPTEEEEEILQYLNSSPGLEFHVHLHHEWWTDSAYTWPHTHNDTTLLRKALAVHLAHFAKNTAMDVTQWGFIHGCWALNASDKAICNIENEIDLLMSMGCIADFSFPAGRPWCDPLAKSPFTVLPVNRPKGYNWPEACVRSVGLQCNAFESGRFLIWNAVTPTAYLSIDNIAKDNNVAQAAPLVWLNTSPIIGGTLYIKTHGHSLWWEHWVDGEVSIPTLTGEAIINCFDALRQLRIPIEHCTVHNVIRQLQAFDTTYSKGAIDE